MEPTETENDPTIHMPTVQPGMTMQALGHASPEEIELAVAAASMTDFQRRQALGSVATKSPETVLAETRSAAAHYERGGNLSAEDLAYIAASQVNEAPEARKAIPVRNDFILREALGAQLARMVPARLATMRRTVDSRGVASHGRMLEDGYFEEKQDKSLDGLTIGQLREIANASKDQLHRTGAPPAEWIAAAIDAFGFRETAHADA